MPESIDIMLTELEQSEYQKHISFIPNIIEPDALEATTVAKIPGAEGLLVLTSSGFSFIVVVWGTVSERHRLSFNEIDSIKLDDLKLNVRKKKGFIKNYSFDLLSQHPNYFIKALSKRFDLGVGATDLKGFSDESSTGSRQIHSSTKGQLELGKGNEDARRNHLQYVLISQMRSILETREKADRREKLREIYRKREESALKKGGENALWLERVRQSAEIFDDVGGGRDAKELPNVLEPDESVLAVVSGLYERNNGVMAVTDKRVIFVDKGLINLTVEVFYFKDLSSVRYHKGMMLGELILYAYGNEERISSIYNHHVQPLANLIQNQILRTQQPTQVVVSTPVSRTLSVADEISKLADLKSQGFISDDEFEQLKARIIHS